MNPEPSALHVATLFPLQPSAFGVHNCALHCGLTWSQYCVDVHVAVTFQLKPS
jgi:hypothetical protein